MLWIRRRNTVTLNKNDLEILKQAKESPAVFMKHLPINCQLPPLWSVFSYMMLLENNAPPAVFWLRYRQFLQLASDRDRHYCKVKIPKANGGTRQLAVPDEPLAAHQRIIFCRFLQNFPTDPHAFAYCPGRSIRDCAAPHEGAEILVHLDLRDFFTSVTEDMVYAMFLQNTGYSRKLCRTLAKLCCFKKSLPQGASTSPMISNLVFRPCDEQRARLAQTHGMEYSRYSDDLFFSGARCNVAALLKETKALLAKHGFRLNESKTKVLRKQHRQSVLGLSVNEKLQTSREYRRQLRQQVYFAERFGKDCRGAILAGSYETHLRQLMGKLSYVLHADPDNQTFRNMFHRLEKRLYSMQLQAD